MDNFFPILAVETSSDQCSVAVILDENIFVELNHLQKHIHSEKIITMIESALASASLETSSLKAIAVSIGPGSFTGLRIGLSAVKGIAFASNLPVLPVPTNIAHAFHISEYLPEHSKFSLVTNASTDDVYFSKFVKKGNSIEIVESLKLVDKTELFNIKNEDEKIYGNVGNGNIIKLNYGVTASTIGRWAYLFGKDLLTFDYDYLEPNYFKKFVVKGRS